MNLSPLSSIGPIDGRYHTKTFSLSAYFSEFALIKHRVQVEVEYFIELAESGLPQLSQFPREEFHRLRDLYLHFDLPDAEEVKKIESTTNHDVKAVEYFLRKKFTDLGFGDHVEFIHFGLTSQDINNTSMPLMVKYAMEDCYFPLLRQINTKIQKYGENWKEIPLLARTHGQPASPTKLGKEFLVYWERLNNQFESLTRCELYAKFGGATGNFNAHHVAYPEVNWEEFADKFISKNLGLKRYKYTTQIEHYDHLAAFFDAMKRINVILIDLCRDIWTYISMEYFKQKVVKNEVGSSAMPHKVNPIDFENAEGNLGLANAILSHLAEKLPVSRLQRDLTDSTVARNIGVPFAHGLIAFQSIIKGLDKLLLNNNKIEEDLDRNWAVLAEAIQTILRREGADHPYETLKSLTRKSDSPGKEDILDFINSLDIREEVKSELRKLTPFNYPGIY